MALCITIEEMAMDNSSLDYKLIVDALNRYSEELKEVSKLSSESRKGIYKELALLSESVAVISTQLSAFDRLEMKNNEVIEKSVKFNSKRMDDIEKDMTKIKMRSAGFGGLAGISTVALAYLTKLLK